MRAIESREIDGMKFTVQQLGGKAAGKLFVRLNSYLIPAIAQGGEALGKLNLAKGTDTDIDLGAVGQGLAAASKVLFEKLTEDEYENLLGQLLETATVKTAKGELPLWPQFDDLMAGAVLTQLKVLKFALEVNYRDFFSALGGLKSLAAGAASKFVTLSTSSQSGAAGA